MPDLSSEIQLQTTRSGGKGGQNVNKGETAVIAYFNLASSRLLTAAQKEMVRQKLANRINAAHERVVRSQQSRTQLQNKEAALRKVSELVAAAIKKKKARIATKPSRQAREKRLEGKKRSGERKEGRKKFYPKDI